MQYSTKPSSIIQTARLVAFALIASFFLFSCASNQHKTTGPQIIINQQMMKNNPEDTTFWLVFGLSISICNKDYPSYSFGEFSCAFKMASLVTTSDKDKASKEKENAEEMTVIEESSDPNISFLKGRYEIVRKGIHYIDELYVSGNDKYFLKARSTYVKGQRYYQESEIRTIFENLLTSVDN